MSGHGLSSWSKYRFSVPGIVDVPLGQVLASGFYGTAPTVLAVDADGRLIALIYGKDGVTQRQVVVDADGQIVMVPRGQSGNYLNVDASGYLTSVIKGLDGVTLRTVAVDPTGKILGVLQGDYAGALKTLAVDDKGRMLAVLTDPEDVFGNPAYMGAAELAARLGSIVTLDRRGQVLFMDSFEHGLGKWLKGYKITTGAILASVAYPRSGGLSAYIQVGNAAGADAHMEHRMPYSVESKLGFEFTATFDELTPNITCYIEIRSSIARLRTGFKYSPDLFLLQYLNSADAWATLDDNLDLYAELADFHNFKLVVDVPNSKYARLLTDAYSHPIADLAPYALSPLLPYSIHIWIGEEFRDSAHRQYVWVDDVIVTQNEP